MDAKNLKRSLVLSAFLICAGAVVLPVFLHPEWVKTLTRRLEYRDYYGWRDGVRPFPAHGFWAAFNYDPAKSELFLGKSRANIARDVPIFSSAIEETESIFLSYIRRRKLPRERFGMLNCSAWLLEFNENDICVDLQVVKGP